MPQTRFVLERALAMNHKVIVVVNKVDRPDARLDEIADEVLELLLEIRKAIGMTLVMVTHDMKIAKRADTVYIMENAFLLSRNIDFGEV